MTESEKLKALRVKKATIIEGQIEMKMGAMTHKQKECLFLLPIEGLSKLVQVVTAADSKSAALALDEAIADFDHSVEAAEQKRMDQVSGPAKVSMFDLD